MELLLCVSVIAESRIIGKVYLIRWLHKVLFQLLFLCYFFLASPFSGPLFFPYIFASAPFSEDAVYWNSLIWAGNLVFTVIIFIYHLVINPGVFRFKFPGVHRVVHHWENHSIKYHEQKFCIKFAFHGSIEQDYLSKHVKIQFLGSQ